MNKYGLLIFFFSTCFCNIFFAQNTFNLQGTILDEGNGMTPLSDVSIVNKSQHVNYLANADGSFFMHVNEGDTLRFHKLGFGQKFYYFRSVLNAENYSIQVLMNTDTIHLKPFVAKSLSREKEVQNLFMNSYIRDSLRMITYLRKLQAQQNKSSLLKLYDASQSPVTFIYDQFSQKARNTRRIEKARRIIKEAQQKDDYAR